MPIVPDTKNWTWVLDERCPECGYNAAAIDVDRMSDLVRSNAALWPGLLATETARRRPSDGEWSAVEYGCHVRDVFALFDERLRLMLTEDGPRFANWDQDVTAVEQRYDLQDPAAVADEIVAAAHACAERWATVGPYDWQRTGDRSDGWSFTVETLARYFLHDPIHHVHDVERGTARLAGDDRLA